MKEGRKERKEERDQHKDKGKKKKGGIDNSTFRTSQRKKQKVQSIYLQERCLSTERERENLQARPKNDKERRQTDRW